MTLLVVREEFVKTTGRADLVVNESAYANLGGNSAVTGANYFINAGQRWLDLKQDHPRLVKTYRKDLAANGFALGFEKMISVGEVWAKAVGSNRRQLTLRDAGYLRENYPGPWDEVTAGTPIDVAVNIPFLTPGQYGQTSGSHGDFTEDDDDVIFDTDDTHTEAQLIIMPRVDVLHTIIVVGKFYELDMDTDADKSWWTEMHPEILVMAAAYQLEATYRNTAGMQDYLRIIVEALNGIDKGMVAQEIAGGGQMLG